MKQFFPLLLLFLLLLSSNSQVPPSKALNSCGRKGLGYSKPMSKADCVDKDGNICCFVSSSEYKRNFCAVVVSEIDQEALDEIKAITGDQNLKIECNNGRFGGFSAVILALLVLVLN